MSDTPRTDAATLRYRYHEKRGDWHGQDHFDYVEPESMAELERELIAAIARADSARRDALEEAAKRADALAQDIYDEQGTTDSETGERIIPKRLRDRTEAYEDAADAIRALINAAPPSEQSVQAPSGGQPQETASAAPNTAAVESKSRTASNDLPVNQLATVPPPAVPELPPQAKRHFDFVPKLGMRYKMVAADDYDDLRAVAERLRILLVLSRGETEQQNRRAERAEAECERLREDVEYYKYRLTEILPLFEQARDALPAITLASAKLHGIQLDLGSRMDAAGTRTRSEWDAARKERT